MRLLLISLLLMLTARLCQHLEFLMVGWDWILDQIPPKHSVKLWIPLKTVICNGPMRVFEFDKFAGGTEAVAKKLAELSGKGVTTIIGGGDSVAAAEKVGRANEMSHISTGGGANLELLEGKHLPGVLALDDA